jgi:hypothetical protein
LGCWIAANDVISRRKGIMNMLAVDEHGKVEMIAHRSINSETSEMNFGYIESFEEKMYGITEHQGQQQIVPNT